MRGTVNVDDSVAADDDSILGLVFCLSLLRGRGRTLTGTGVGVGVGAEVGMEGSLGLIGIVVGFGV